MMLGCFMCTGPRLIDGRTILFLLSLGFCAYAVCPVSHWFSPKAKRFLALALPPAIFVCWFMLQRELLLTDRMNRAFYRSMYGETAWRLNSAILVAFGVAFSVRSVRGESRRERAYGVLFVLAFIPLLFGFNSINPVSETSSLHYRWDGWTHPPAVEPSFKGKSLSYWASRANGLAEESEPALQAIRAMGPDAVRALIQAFRTGEGSWSPGEERPQPWDVRRHAVEALLKLGPDARPAVPLMTESLRNSDRTIRDQAAEVLGRTGDGSQAVVDALIQALEDEATEYNAMKSLARLGENNPGIIRQLAATAKGHKAKAAYWATVSLAEIGNASSLVLPDLIECVQRAPNDQRQHAVQAIALCGTNAGAAVPALTSALKDSQEWTRKCIYIALGRIGPSASNAIPSLQTALTNESYLPARMDIARALWRIDPSQTDLVLAAIRQSLNDGSSQLRRDGRVSYDFLSALDLIGEVGTRAGIFVPDLQNNLNSRDADIQFSAAWAMLKVSPDLAEPAIATLRHLTGLEEYPLEHIGSEEWGRGLSELKRKRESFHLRMAAAGALWQNSEQLKAPLTGLISELLRDWDYFTSMKHVIPEARAAVPALSAIAEDPAQPQVHDAAREALRAICGSAGERW